MIIKHIHILSSRQKKASRNTGFFYLKSYSASISGHFEALSQNVKQKTKPAQKLNFGSEMGQKTPRGSVSISNESGRIRLRWRYLSKRYSVNFSAYSKANLIEAKKVALIIELDVLTHKFDKTLGKYFKKYDDYANASKKQSNPVALFESWVKEYLNLDCEKNIDYHQVRNMMRKWSGLNEHNILTYLNSEKVSPKTYNERLALLKRYNKWMYKQGYWSSCLLEDVNKRKEKKSIRLNRIPFTQIEIKQILEAIKSNRFQTNKRYTHSHYFPFLYFLVSTGVRNAEAIGLRVGSIDFENGLIHIKESLARTIKGSNSSKRIRKGTKTGIERSIPLMDDLKLILLPLIKNKNFDDLVFLSHNGLSIDDKKFQKYVFKPVQIKLGIEPRVLYACRHYFGSNCIENGITPVQTAFLMGNSPEVCLRNYTHQMKIPKELPYI